MGFWSTLCLECQILSCDHLQPLDHLPQLGPVLNHAYLHPLKLKLYANLFDKCIDKVLYLCKDGLKIDLNFH